MPGILNQRFSSAFFVTLCASSLLALGLLAHPWLRPVAGAAATITVNTTADDDTVNGNCTLREAIQAANTDTAVDACTAGSGTDTIAFAIPGAGLHTIAPTSQLPTITAPVILDGTTQAGASCTTAGGLKIELNGAGTGGGAGLFVTAGNSTVKGLVINRFLSNGVLLLTNGGNTVSCNYIGTDVVGTTDLGNAGNGVAVGDSPNNIIGGTTASAGNLISGNNEEGVLLDGAASTGNQIQGNLIGTNAAGTTALANSFSGVLIRASANGNTVGGTVSSARNVISGNTGLGILIGTNNNTIQGNYVGTNSAGTAAVSNGLTGIELGNGTANNLIGGPTVSTRNLVSGNLGHGIVVNAANNNTVQNNYVGTDATGTTAVGNQFNGISLAGTNNTIGGIGAGNLVSGNGGVGLFLIGASTTGNQVKGNSIGTNAAGTAALANNAGLFMEAGAANNQIGGAAVGEGNLISGNLGSAVAIASCPNTSLQGNLIGTNAAGTAALGNGGAGLDVFGNSPNTLIGGTAAGARNIISANGQFGIGIGGSATTGTQVQGNYIGTDSTGTIDVGNTLDGVLIADSATNTIGGTAAGAGNVISGNNRYGVEITNASSTGNLVRGNFIGTNAAGTAAVGNSLSGVVVANAPSNTIGGTVAEARNVISGNGQRGVYLSAAGTTSTLVQGNFIGTDVTGAIDVGNTLSGVQIDGAAASNTIGGTTAAARNIISGNNQHGVLLLTTGGTGNLLQGNFIGTDVTGLLNVANTFDGVRIANSSANTVGGTAAGASNTLAFNTQAGVGVSGSGTGNVILKNSTFSNGGLGIDLGATGVTANDANDPDIGVNNLQNFPVFSSVGLCGPNLMITYSVPSIAPFSTFPIRVEFFIADAANQEGKTFLGADSYTAPGQVASIPAGGAILGTQIVATATDNAGAGNTSEFSANATVGSCLLAAGGVAPSTAPKPAALTTAQLAPIVEAAITRLAAQGLTPAQVKQLSTVTFAIADLPGATLGLATPRTITLDVNAAGYGWFIDPTPFHDSEYGPKKLSPPATLVTPARTMDLLTAVMHELGHTLGRNDLHDHGAESDLMYETLAAGTRRTTFAAVDAVFAGPSWIK